MIPIKKLKKIRSYKQSLNWWNEMPLQDIRGNNGWANLVMIYYPDKTDCQDVTEDEIYHMYIQEKMIQCKR